MLMMAIVVGTLPKDPNPPDSFCLRREPPLWRQKRNSPATASQSAPDRQPCPRVRIENGGGSYITYTSGWRVLLEMAVSLLMRDIWMCIRPLRIFDVS